MTSKPYYLLHEAIFQAIEHGMEFGGYGENSVKLLLLDAAYADRNEGEEIKYYPSDRSVFEPREGDLDKYNREYASPYIKGEFITAFRNGKPFLNPRYEVKND